MPAERITMRQAREIIRLKATSISAHEISRRLGVPRSTVRAVSTLTPGARMLARSIAGPSNRPGMAQG